MAGGTLGTVTARRAVEPGRTFFHPGKVWLVFLRVYFFFFRKVTAFKGIDTFLAKKYCNPSQNTLTDRKKKEINIPVFSFLKVKSPKCCQKWIHSQAL